MRLTCPRCSTEYDVPDAALAAGGRRLRCDHCGHQWRQAAPDSAPPVPEAFVTPDLAVKPDHVTTENLPKFLTKRDTQGAHVVPGDEQGLTERRHSIGMESQPRRPAQKGHGLRRWIVLLVVVLIIIGVLLARRSI